MQQPAVALMPRTLDPEKCYFDLGWQEYYCSLTSQNEASIVCHYLWLTLGQLQKELGLSQADFVRVGCRELSKKVKEFSGGLVCPTPSKVLSAVHILQQDGLLDVKRVKWRWPHGGSNAYKRLIPMRPPPK